MSDRPKDAALQLEKMCPEKWTWPANIPLEEWGRRGWRWLHITAINYSRFPSADESRIVYRRIWNFVRGLPCDNCCSHGLAYLIRYPPDLRNSESLQRWMHDFHNSVNTRLKKPTISFEEYRGLYADEICWAYSGGGCSIAAAPDAALKMGLGEWYAARRDAGHRKIGLPSAAAR
jgi:hypothetical protein